MKRTFTDASHLSAKARTAFSSSTTQLTLTFRPNEAHASIASSTRCGSKGLWASHRKRRYE